MDRARKYIKWVVRVEGDNIALFETKDLARDYIEKENLTTASIVKVWRESEVV